MFQVELVVNSLIRTMPHVMVISSDGYFYSYSIDLDRGGECSLMKQYRYIKNLSCCLPYFRHHTHCCYNSLLDSGEESGGLEGKHSLDGK